MPVTFDFNNDGAFVNFPDVGTTAISNTDNGVTFTVTGDAAGGTQENLQTPHHC